MSFCVCVLTMMVPDVFMPCSRMATRVNTNIRGPYSSPAIFCKQEVDYQNLDLVSQGPESDPKTRSFCQPGDRRAHDRLSAQSLSLTGSRGTYLGEVDHTDWYEGLDQPGGRRLVLVSVILRQTQEVAQRKQEVGGPTCCGPALAPRRSTASVCRCWRTD